MSFLTSFEIEFKLIKFESNWFLKATGFHIQGNWFSHRQLSGLFFHDRVKMLVPIFMERFIEFPFRCRVSLQFFWRFSINICQVFQKWPSGRFFFFWRKRSMMQIAFQNFEGIFKKSLETFFESSSIG